MKTWVLFLIMFSDSWASPPPSFQPVNCGCEPHRGAKSCGVVPAFMQRDEIEISRELGFDVPGDNVQMAKTAKGLALYIAFASFLEKTDRSRMFYPEFYTRKAEEVSELTFESRFVPKNIAEMDEYFRCTIPSEKYCLYKKSLKPYIALAAKSSGIDFSFLACQSYVESRFNKNARSVVGAVGYSQILPRNIRYLNEVLRRSIRRTSPNRKIASTASPREVRINKAQQNIAEIWSTFWEGSKKIPTRLTKSDLTCHRQVFLAQALALKTDMLALATSSSGLTADFDDQGNFIIEEMDKNDSLLLLAGAYNVGVTKMIKLISKYCGGSTNLRDCLDKIQEGVAGDPTQKSLARDVNAFVNYIMRIRDCAQQFSAEKIDFDDDDRWTTHVRTQKMNQQRDQSVQCLLHPCPYPKVEPNTGKF